MYYRKAVLEKVSFLLTDTISFETCQVPATSLRIKPLPRSAKPSGAKSFGDTSELINQPSLKPVRSLKFLLFNVMSSLFK